MKKWIVLLSGVLLAQLVLAVIVNVTGDDYGAYEADEQLLIFDQDAVDRILIEDSANSVTLTKKNKKWLLPAQNDFPADQNNISQLLDKLTAMKRGWPIATTSGASKRFKVVEDEFERRLTLYANSDMLGQVYIGNSPGFRKVHARNVDDDEVFAVNFNTWEASSNTADWIDKHILAFSAEDILHVGLPGFVLQSENDEIQLVDVDDQEKVNQLKIETLVNSLSGLQIDSLLNEEETENLPDENDFTFNVTLAPDNNLIYDFYKLDEEPYYLLKRSDFDEYFKIAEFHVNAIKEVTREQLLLPETENESGSTNKIENSDNEVAN